MQNFKKLILFLIDKFSLEKAKQHELPYIFEIFSNNDL